MHQIAGAHCIIWWCAPCWNTWCIPPHTKLSCTRDGVGHPDLRWCFSQPAATISRSPVRSLSILALRVWVCCIWRSLWIESVFSLLHLLISCISKDPAGQEANLEDHKGLEDHSDRISVGVTKRARRKGGKPRWLSHSKSCTCSPWKRQHTSYCRLTKFVKRICSWDEWFLSMIHVVGLLTLNHCRSAIGLSASVLHRPCNAHCAENWFKNLALNWSLDMRYNRNEGIGDNRLNSVGQFVRKLLKCS